MALPFMDAVRERTSQHSSRDEALLEQAWQFSAKAAGDDALFNQARDQSVVDNPHVGRDGTSSMWIGVQSFQGPILPPWGTRKREFSLRYWYRHEYSSMLQGAFMGLVKKWVATPWTIDGGKILANRFQRIFLEAEFDYGWGSFLSRVMLDYLRFDGGAYVELIGPGDPRGEMTGALTGLAHLDSYRTWPTGDPEYPAVYWSRLGQYHVMHRTRLMHLVDMPDGDSLNPGYGLCALSRAIAVVQRELYMQNYIRLNLDDTPSSGFVVVNNATREELQNAFKTMRETTSNDAQQQPGKVAFIHSANPAFPISLTNFNFARPPEKFDWNVYVQVDVDMMALAIGVDRQDLWPLNTRSMGSGAQSEILAEKAKGKTFGNGLIELERGFNQSALPEALEFAFKTSDSAQAAQDAQTALVWAQAIVQMGNRISNDEARRLLAAQVEAVEDVVVDESGQVVELPDTDIVPLQGDQISPLTNPALPPTTEQAPAGAAPPDGNVTANDKTPNPNASAQKDFEDDRAAFVANIVDLIHGSVNDDVTRRRADVVMRGILNSAGKAARNDGLIESGITTGLSDADLSAHAAWLAQTSPFVTDFLDSTYKNGLTDAQIEQHAEMWANRSIQTAYTEGLESGDADAVYEFTGSDGKESCATCTDLKGTKMRMSEWTAQKLRPGVDSNSFECGSWNCQHILKRVTA